MQTWKFELCIEIQCDTYFGCSIDRLVNGINFASFYRDFDFLEYFLFQLRSTGVTTHMVQHGITGVLDINGLTSWTPL